MKKYALISLVFLSTSVLFSCKSKKDKDPTANEAGGETVSSGTETSSTPATASPSVVGTYKGEIPCADCPGINETLTLSADSTYELTSVYQERNNNKPETDKGKYTVSGDTLKLSIKNAPSKYLIKAGELQQLDGDGKPITGDLADKYILKKQS